VSARVEDVRYRRYGGERRGRAQRLASFVRFGARTALGARRGWKAKLIPIALIAIAFLPALVVLGVKALFSNVEAIPEILSYRDYYGEIGFVVLLFAGLIAPELLCPDRRDRVLSLYLSTAVSWRGYVVGRVLAVFAPLLLVTLVPQTVLFIGNVIFALEPIDYLRDEWDMLPRILLSGLVLSAYFGLLALAVASLTSRRAFAMGGYVGLMIISGAVGGTIAFGFEATYYAQLMQLLRVPIEAVMTLFPHGGVQAEDALDPWLWWATTALVCVVSSLILVWRYRDAE
jgi:ABC-2 type transport system permease protein